MPELDVLRGLAILMVVLFHGLYWSGQTSTNLLFGLFIKATVFGWLGVNLFFVLSGFLITGILLDSRTKPDYYKRFYRRRALRILPAYFATIVVLYFARNTQTVNLRLLSAIGFYANYVTGGYGPFWSLSVEEQFYLVWPAIIKKISIHWLTWLCLSLCFLEPGLRWFDATHNQIIGNAKQATYLIADNLAIGGLAAIFARSSYGTLRNGVRAGLVLCIAGIGIFLIGYPFGILHRNTVVGSALQTLPWNLCFAGALLLSLGLRSPWFTSSWAKPLTFLGYISYGLYLIHGLLFGLYDDRLLPLISNQSFLRWSLVRFTLVGGASILVAWLSRRYYEEPCLRRGRQ
jgi:peptidoglycan/LPS O-acetylase OafA/YrhL